METTSKPARGDLFYETLVRAYVETPLFIARPWLERLVLDKVGAADCRFVLLTAEPGAGKSTFTAQLARDHPDWPRYFIRRDQRQLLSNAGARSFLLRIGFQLAETYPDLFQRDDLVLDVAQEVGEIRESGTVIGVSVKKLVASPFYRQLMVKVKQNVEQISGSLKGVQIDTIVADPRLLSLHDLQEMALFDPARRLQTLAPQQNVMILVDALDELRYHDTKDNILQWLTGCPIGDLPENVRFILTSRPPDQALTLFYHTQKPNVQSLVLTLDAQAEPSSEVYVQLQADARAYVDQLVALPDLEPYWAQANKTPAAFAADAFAKAEGNLGYLDAIARALLLAIERNDRTTIHALLSLEALPEALKDLYVLFLRTIQARLGDLSVSGKAPSTGEAVQVHVHVWDEVCLRILGILAVAQAPLTVQQIHHLGRINVSLPVTSSHLDRLKNFLDQVGNAYRLYHASFAEFLTDPATIDTAPEFYCDPDMWHGHIAGFYCDRHKADWSDCDAYGLTYLPVHLVQARQSATLPALVLNLSWIKAKLVRNGVASLLSDFALVPDNDDVRRLGQVVRQISHLLVQDPMQLMSQLLARLPQTGAFAPLLAQIRQDTSVPWLQPLLPSLQTTSMRLYLEFIGHTNRITALATLPGRGWVISASDDNLLKVWDMRSRTEIYSLAGHEHRVKAIAVSADEQTLVSASYDRTLIVWNLETGQQAYRLSGHDGLVVGVSFDATERYLVSVGMMEAILWDLSDRTMVERFNGTDWPVQVPDSLAQQTGLNYPGLYVQMWRWLEARGIRLPLGLRRWSDYGVTAILPGGRYALFGGYEQFGLWDLDGGAWRHQWPNVGPAVATVSADNQALLFGTQEGALTLWDIPGQQEIAGWSFYHTMGITALALTPDRRYALTGDGKGVIRMWDLAVEASHSESIEGVETTGAVRLARLTSDGRQAITAIGDQKLRLWHLGDPPEARDLPLPSGYAKLIALIPDKHWGVSDVGDALLVWDIDSRQAVCSLKGWPGACVLTRFTPDGRYAVMVTRREVSPESPISPHLAIPSAEYLDTYSALAPQFHLMLWDLAHAKMINEIEISRSEPQWAVDQLTMTPDGLYAAVLVSNYQEALRYKGGRITGEIVVYHLRESAEVKRQQWRYSGKYEDDKRAQFIALAADGQQTFTADNCLSVATQGQYLAQADDNLLTLSRIVEGHPQPLSVFYGIEPFNTCHISADGQVIVAIDVAQRVHFLRLTGSPDFGEF